MSKKKVFAIVFNDLKNDNRVLNQAFSLASDGHDVTLMGIQRHTALPTHEHVTGVRIRVSAVLTLPRIARKKGDQTL